VALALWLAAALAEAPGRQAVRLCRGSTPWGPAQKVQASAGQLVPSELLERLSLALMPWG
jgi:hypothetical protein